jgi:hypothetical protein
MPFGTFNRAGALVFVRFLLNRPSLTGLNEVPEQCERAQLPCIGDVRAHRQKMRCSPVSAQGNSQLDNPPELL